MAKYIQPKHKTDFSNAYVQPGKMLLFVQSDSSQGYVLTGKNSAGQFVRISEQKQGITQEQVQAISLRNALVFG